MMPPSAADVFKRAESGKLQPEDGPVLMREIEMLGRQVELRQRLIEAILPYVPPNAPMDGLILEHAAIIWPALVKAGMGAPPQSQPIINPEAAKAELGKLRDVFANLKPEGTE